MHQLWQHPNGTYYVLYGPRLRRRISTRSKDRGRAETYLSQFIAGATDPLPEQPTVGAFLTQYEDERGPEVRSPGSLKTSVAALRPHFGNLLPGHLTRPTVKAFADKRLAAGVKPGTILRDVGVLRAAFSWALEHKRIAKESIPKIRNPVPTPKPRERWATKDEARRLIAACQEPHVKLFVTLGLMTVPRMAALLEAKWSQVNWDQRLIDYGEGHGNKRRAIVPLNDDVLALLQAAKQLASTDYIVEYRGGPVETVKNGFAAACRRAGIEGVTPHILRHSGATWMALAAVPMRDIAQMLGDSEATTERVYAKYHPAYLKRAASALQLKEAAE